MCGKEYSEKAEAVLKWENWFGPALVLPALHDRHLTGAAGDRPV